MNTHSSHDKTERCWYLNHLGTQEGPFSLEEARGIVLTQNKSKALCWKEGMESWRPVSQQVEFALSDVANTPTKRVSWPLAAGIFLAPYIFVWWLLRKGYGTHARAIGFSWTAIFFIALIGSSGQQENVKLTSQTKASEDASTTSESKTTCNMGFLSSAYVTDGRVDFKVEVTWRERAEWLADKILERAFEVAKKCPDATILRATVTAEAEDRFGNSMPDQTAIFDIDLNEARKYRDSWKYINDGERAFLVIRMRTSSINYALK